MKVAFTPGKGFFAWLIRSWTFGKYAHCELVFSDGVWFGCSYYAPFRVGARDYVEPGLHWDFVDISVSKEQEEIIRQWCYHEEGSDYDWAGIMFSQVVRLGGHSRRRWFCSEICAAAIQQVGYLLNFKPQKISPNKLHKLLTKK